MYVQRNSNPQNGGSGSGGSSGSSGSSGSTSGTGRGFGSLTWGTGARGSNTADDGVDTSLEEYEGYVDELIKGYEEAVEYPDPGNIESRVANRTANNPYLFGSGADVDAWLAHAKETGVFVGYPGGLTAEAILSYADNSDGDEMNDVRAILGQLNHALAQLNQVFVTMAAYATDAQLKALFNAISAPSNLSEDQARGDEEIPDGMGGGWLSHFMTMMQAGSEDFFDNVMDEIRGNDFGAVFGEVLRGATKALYDQADKVGIDLSEEPDNWRLDAAFELAKKSQEWIFAALHDLTPEEQDQFEAYLKEQKEKLLRGEDAGAPSEGASSSAPASGGSRPSTPPRSNDNGNDDDDEDRDYTPGKVTPEEGGDPDGDRGPRHAQ